MLDGSSQVLYFQLLSTPTGGFITNPSSEGELLDQAPVYDGGIYWNYIPCVDHDTAIFGCVDPNDVSYDPLANVDNSVEIGPITYYPLC